MRSERHGRYWSGLVLSVGPFTYTLFFSVHVLHQQREQDDSSSFVDAVRQDTLEYWHYCRHRFGSRLSVVVGFDANVTLPRDVLQTIGIALLRPLKSHSTAMQQRILGWMQSIGLRALNACGHALAGVEV